MHSVPVVQVLQALVIIRLLPWIGKQPFGVSYWAFSFSVTAFAIAALLLIERGDSRPVLLLAPLLFAAASVIIALLAFATVRDWTRGQLLPARTLEAR